MQKVIWYFKMDNDEYNVASNNFDEIEYLLYGSNESHNKEDLIKRYFEAENKLAELRPEYHQFYENEMI